MNTEARVICNKRYTMIFKKRLDDLCVKTNMLIASYNSEEYWKDSNLDEIFITLQTCSTFDIDKWHSIYRYLFNQDIEIVEEDTDGYTLFCCYPSTDLLDRIDVEAYFVILGIPLQFKSEYKKVTAQH